MDDLNKLKEIFLANDIDAEDYQDNLAMIQGWEKDLIANESMESWKNHDVTQIVLKQTKESYIALSLQLVQNRDLSDKARASLWAKQDACLWLISLMDIDVQSKIEQINNQIKTALNATI